MDTIKTLAHDRHFHTAEIRLADYGQVLLVGDRRAVARLVEVIREHAAHDLISIDTDDPGGKSRLSRLVRLPGGLAGLRLQLGEASSEFG
jgi:hypothetical protein